MIDLIFFDRLNETNTPLTEIPKKFDRKNYRTDVFAIDNTPEVPAQGIQVKKKRLIESSVS